MNFLIFIVCTLVQYTVSVTNDNRTSFEYGVEIPEDAITSQLKEEVALGRVASLGDLYDARTDRLLGMSLYTTKTHLDSQDIVYSIDSAYSGLDYVRTESLSEKMSKLGLSPSLSISFISGLIDVKGSGNYLKQNKQKPNSVKASLIYRARTKQDYLNIFSEKSKNAIDHRVLEVVDATHVVVGMEWGTNAILSIEETDTDSFNSQEMEEKLVRTLHQIAISVSDEYSQEDFEVERSRSFWLHFNGDIYTKKIPQTIKESIRFIRDIPQLIKNENGEKGQIMKYILMPITTVRKVLNVSSVSTGKVEEMEKELIDKFIEMFQEMRDSELQINEVYNNIAKWRFMVLESELQEITKIKQKFDVFFNDFRLSFAKQVENFRNGRPNDFNSLFHKYHLSNWTSASVGQVLKIHDSTLKKIRLLNLFQSFKALFIDRRTDVSKILAKNYNREIRIISLSLSTDIRSHDVRKIVTLLDTEIEKVSALDTFEVFENSSKIRKPIRYYIKDDPDCIVPDLKAYLKGNLIDLHPVEREYVLLISQGGAVTIIDAVSYNVVNYYTEIKLQNLSFAVVNNTLYSVDTKKGSIRSTFIGNINKKPEKEIEWQHVGSFRSENTAGESNTAVNGSSFYFMSSNGDLYNYDITLRTVTFKSNIIGRRCTNSSGAASMIVSEGMLYININYDFCYFDGEYLDDLLSPHLSSRRSALFESKLGICRVGSAEKSNPNKNARNKDRRNLVNCYEPERKGWTPVSDYRIFTNEHRQCPGIATTQSGTMIFGGSDEAFTSAEIFNEGTEEWSYIPIPSSIKNGCYSAFSIWF